jgi:hypothetical protein
MIQENKSHQVVTALFLFLCLAAADNGGRPLVPDVTGVLPPRFCALDPDAGGAGRWPGTKPLPGVRRRRTPSSDGVGDGLGVEVPCWSPSSVSIVASCNSISRLASLAASMAWSRASLQGNAKEAMVSFGGGRQAGGGGGLTSGGCADDLPSDGLALTLAAALRDLFPGDEERRIDRSRFWP